MNIIQKQVDDFINHHMSDHDEYKDFIDKILQQLLEYRKTTYKKEFTGQQSEINK